MLDVIHRLQALGDLGLACALCLISGQHGIVLASNEELDEVAKVLAAVCLEPAFQQTTTL